MRPSARGKRRLRHCAFFALLLAGGASVASAQPVRPPETEEPPAPVDRAPPQSPFATTVPQTSASPLTADASGGTITSVRVIADASGTTAVPPDGWVPPSDSAGIPLEHQPRQPLDAAWVQHQFDRATAAGPVRPSAAIALVQLINRAFVTAGFVNSGLLVVNRPTAGAGPLDVRLVYGRLSAAEASAEPMTVEWGNGHAAGLDADYIRTRFPSAAGRPLNALQLERDFRLLDESASIRSISAALRPGTRPGEASLALVIYPAERVDFYTGVANDRSPAVGGDHLFAGGFVRNLLNPGDLLTVEGGITRGIEDGQFDYSTPLFVPRLVLGLRGSFNNAAVITSALDPLDIHAKDRSAEIGFAYQAIHAPLMMRGTSDRWSPSESLTAGLALLGRWQKSYLLGQPFSFAPGSVDGQSEYHAIRLSGDYVRRDLSRVIALSLGATLGLGGTRSDVPGIPNPHSQFVGLLGQVHLAQRLGNGLELRGRLIGQTSRGTLYSGLRIAVGGINSVRGYRDSLFLVDRAVIGTLELAKTFDLSADKGGSGGFRWGAFSVSVFADGAAFKNAEKPQPEERWLGSVGASLAWIPSDAFEASVTYGHALNDVPGPENRTLQDRGIHFRLIVHPAGLF